MEQEIIHIYFSSGVAFTSRHFVGTFAAVGIYKVVPWSTT
jgi:hypothetical protein